MSELLVNANSRRIPLASESVDMCVTSPPYFGLRDYGVADQLGLEETPEQYVVNIVAVFREVWRVMKPQGTLWLNIGDSYWANRAKNGEMGGIGNSSIKGRENHARAGGLPREDIKPKDLIGIPWMLAFALRADGWYLRSDIIWHKQNPMPESVTDRPTKSHEYIFLLAKQRDYYYDADVISEESKWKGDPRAGYGRLNYRGKRKGADGTGQEAFVSITDKKNKRSVWSVNVKPYKGAHFATFPPDLIEPCILAGCPKGGIVLDPFMGSGTTAWVARKLERESVGLELSFSYLHKQARERLGWDRQRLF